MIVALEMLDGPVSHDHGGPVRMYVDGQYGYKSTKWLSGIELTEDEVPGYWEHRGYDIDGDPVQDGADEPTLARRGSPGRAVGAPGHRPA